MLQPRRTLLLYLIIVILSTCGLLLRNVDCKTEVSDDRLDSENDLHLHKPSKVDRIKRDVGDVTTVLLVDNTGRHRDGRFNKKAVGLLTSTARTFVQEGTTTEFATQVVGTTLDNGRLYAQVVTTSSRVFYQGDSGGRDKTRTRLDELVLPSIPLVADIARPTQPIQVLPSQIEDSIIEVEPFSYAKSGNIYQTAVNRQQTPYSRYIGDQPRINEEVIRISTISHGSNNENYETEDQGSRDELEALFLQAKAKKHSRFFPPPKENESEESENLVKAKRMDYFKKKNTADGDDTRESETNDVKPARVRPLDDLPTYTIRHDFAPSGFSFDDNYEDSTESQNLETSPRGSRFRSGKSFFRNRVEQRKLDTVTYLGFSDFTTTVGDTVIVFMPHTSAAGEAHQGRKVTSISGDATLAPELQHSTTDRQVSVVTSVKTFMSHTPGMITRTITGHSLSMQTALPTMVVLPESPTHHHTVHYLPQSVTIRRDKALQSVHIVDPVTEELPTDFDDIAQYLANEQQDMAEKIPTTTPTQDLTTEALVDSETIEPSSVSYKENIESSMEEIVESSPVESSPIESSTEDFVPQSTDSLGYFSTAQTQLFDTGGAEYPLGLIKVVGGTEALNGTTTLFTSLVYGTNIDGNYAQVIHSTSSVFYYVDDTKVDLKDTQRTIEPTAVLDTPNVPSTTTPSPPITTIQDEESTEGTTSPPTTFSQPSDSTNELPETTTESNYITTFEQSTTEEEDGKKTTKLDETLTTVPMEETTTEADTDSFNEVETGRKISSKPKDQIIVDAGDDKGINEAEKSAEEIIKSLISQKIISPTSNHLLTQLIPTTVYKTFTYFTTFFIPAEGSLTTTSIRSREVTSSEINYVATTFDPAVKSHVESSVAVKSNVAEISGSITIIPTVSSKQEVLQTTTPEDKTIGTTDREEETEQTTMTTPELPEEKTTLTTEELKITTTTPKSTIEGEQDEIELIFKTLYTTYTYLTTFFQESTTSVSSREEVITNVVTSTVDRSYILHASDPAVAGLFNPDDLLSSSSKQPVPTSVGIGRPTTKYFPDSGTNPDEDLFSSVIESVDIEKELATPTPALDNKLTSIQNDNELKTFYTTYTYFTTILVDGETEVESRTEIYTNIVTPSGLVLNSIPSTIEPTISLREPLFENSEPSVLGQLEPPHLIPESSFSSQIKTPVLKSTPLYSYSSTISRSHKSPADEIESYSSNVLLGSSLNNFVIDDEENSIFPKNTAKFESSYATISRPRNVETTPTISQDDTSSKSPIASREVVNYSSASSLALASSSIKEVPVIVEKMSTDVTSSSSDGGRVMMLEKRNDKHSLLDDQISSESNTEAVDPSPTILLQTSFTTFTYFTTVYKGSTSSDIISRLETVTNVVTETLTPSAAPTISIAPEDATLPITYFTTFTYWTTLYKDSSTIVTSREETISNVVTPSVSPSSSIVLPLEITPSPTKSAEIVTPTTSAYPEPTTFFTTYTYFTTSYIGNSTVLSSRLETVTNIVNGSTTDATGRAIGSGASEQKLPTETKKPEVTVQPSTALQPTGLLSTIMTSEVHNGTTTLFSTDVYGTFIDGLYAQVLESSTQIVTPPLISPTTPSVDLKPTGVVSLNEGKIIDAMGVSTTFFTTRAIGTYIDALYAEVVESTTSTYINDERKSILEQLSPRTAESSKTPRTGLVRIVEGSIVKDQTTTYYESKVIGTLIDGRYAQIIESTTSFKVAVAPTSVPGTGVNEIAPTSALSPIVSVTPTISSTTSPTPAVIESSLNEGGSPRDEEEEPSDGEEESDENDGKTSKKSRLSFTSRKRTFTPTIRPFSSRNRPIFNPKRKTALGSTATTITRTSVTPTVTATPAAKGESGGRNKFNNNRRGSSSGLYKTDIRATPSGSGGRRTSRVRGSTAGGAVQSSSHFSGRGRSSSGSSRIYATSTAGQAGASRRGAFYRSSSGRPGGSSDLHRGSTIGIHHGASSSRFRIRPTQSSILGRGGNTAYTTPSSDETLEPEDNLTTLVTEETPHFTDNEQDSQTQPISTTTESPRRSSNPLLKFRRPPTLRTPQTTSTTPKTTTTQSPRRSPLLRRPPGSTTPRSRSSNRYNPLTNRQRTTNSLFPPRGLLKRPEKDGEEEEEEKKEEDEEEQDENGQEEGGEEQEDDDFGDNDYEGSETNESKTKPNKSNRRSSQAYNPVQIRPFSGFNRRTRVKRQTEYGSKSGSGSRSFTPRYRRPASGTSKSQQESAEEQDPVQDAPKAKQPNPGRFTPRARSSAASQPRVRPTSASSNSARSQFTLRKDDSTTSNRANFRRPTTQSPRRRPNNKPQETSYTAQRPKPPRLRTQSTSSRQTEATTFSRTNSARRNPNTRGRANSRTRSRLETSDFDTYTYSQSSFDGTITVTHHIPTEVTIPVVNGQVTEYRNIITASLSTEVLGPHQYTVSTAVDGNTMLYLTSEVTGTLPSGATEITQFVIHETPTTSVIFTPTVIRGHKTSYSHIIPSTVYDVEQVVNTLQPQISPNAPLANILLSQLLLGNLGLQPNINPLLALNNPGPPPTPTTEFKTRQTTYVTTVTKGTSTVIPLTFRGKEILTTIVDSSTEVITATEFITDTIVVTPTAGNNQLNSLLLPALLQAQLLGQPQPQPMIPMVPNPLLAGLQQQLLQQEQKPNQDVSIEDLLSNQPSRRRQRPIEEPDRLVRDSVKDILDEDAVQNVKEEETTRDHSFKRKKIRTNKKPPDPPPVPAETSVVTLYVSGRRPGEFSTVISTVTLGEGSSAAVRKREAVFAEPEMYTVSASRLPEIGGSFPTSDDDDDDDDVDDGYLDKYVMSAINEVSGQDTEIETQSLESIVGDVSRYVSSVIGQSSSYSKLHLSKPSLTKNPASLSTDNKKKHSSKKNLIASSFNSTSFAGHFLSNGPAESAPLKRKVLNSYNRGTDEISSIKYSTSKTKILNHSLLQNSTQALNNADIVDTLSARKKRSIEEITTALPHRRKRVRVRVPVNKKKTDNDKFLKEELLTVSEAQQRDRIPDMEIGENSGKIQQGKPSPQLEFGSRRIKIIRARKPVNLDSNEDENNHPRRVIVTRRRKPEHSTIAKNNDDSFISVASSTDFEVPLSKQQVVPSITTYHPREIPNFVSNSMVGKDDTSFDIIPTTIRGDSIIRTTPGRRRVVITKKRPIVPTSIQRRRIVITKKRPISKAEVEIEPTNVIMDSMSTLYSYKYTILNREKGLNTDTEKMVKVSQIYMSGKIPGSEEYNHDPEKHTAVDNFDDDAANYHNLDEDHVPQSYDLESKQKDHDHDSNDEIAVDDHDLRDVRKEDKAEDNTSFLIENEEKEESEKEIEVSIIDKISNSKDILVPISNTAILEIPTSTILTIQPSQIESSFQVISHSLDSETPKIEGSTKDISHLMLSEGIDSIPLTEPEIIPSLETSLVQKPNLINSSSKELENSEYKDDDTSNDKDQENNENTEDKNDDKSIREDEIESETLIKLSTPIESSISSTEETTYDGPRFIRPTRFSITRKPGNTRTGFPGRRRTSSITPSLSLSGRNSYSSSNTRYKSSYRGRRPSSSGRAFGRNSKTSLHFYTTPSTNLIEPSSIILEPISSLSEQKSNLPETTSDLPEPTSILSEDILSTSLSDTPLVESSVSELLPSSLSETPILDIPSTPSTVESTVVTEVITTTRLRTFTYIVTRVAGEEQVVTSTTEVKPRVTTLTVTKTLPILATEFRGKEEGRGLNMNAAGEARYNLATKVMSNGVEVIVAGDKSTLPGEPEVLRVLSSSLSRPITLAPSTLTDHMVLFLPPESSQVESQLSSSLQQQVFVTKTYLTTYTYLTTFLQDGTTAVSSHEKIVSNIVTEERTGTNMVTPTPIVGITLSESPSLATGVFHTTYTYLNTLLDGDVPLVVTSHRTVANTLTAPQDYLLQLQPSGESTLDTNTYLSTVAFTKTLTEGDDVKIVSTKDILTQVVITESDKTPTDVKGVPENTPLTVQPSPQQGSITNVVKTYFVTYTYFSTFLEGGSTVIRSNIAISSDIVTENFYVTPKRTMAPILAPTSSFEHVIPTSKIVEINTDEKLPLHLYATKTYLTTFTYFTTLLQDGGGDRTSTIVSSRTNVIQNVVTESVDTNLLDPEYLESLRSSILADSASSSSIVAMATLSGGQQLMVTAMDHIIKPTSVLDSEITPTANHHELSSSMEETSNNPNNIITGSTIIFFDEEDQIDSSGTSNTLAIQTASHAQATPSLSSALPINQLQSTVVNTEASTISFPLETIVAQPLVSSSSSALAPQDSVSFVLPSSLANPLTFSPIAALTTILASSTVAPNGATLQPGDEVIMMTQAGGNITMIPVSDPANKRPNGGGFGPGGSEIEVSDLLSLGSLGINGLNALGPVINAMAGLIHSNLNNDRRRNDTTYIVLPSSTSKPQPAYFGNNPGPVYVPPKPVKPLQEGTTVRSPIYIPVGAVATGDADDVDTAESQQYEGIVNLNGDVKWPVQGFPDTIQRRPADSATLGRPIESALLGDGIPISPGQVITANSDVIVGKPAIMGPRPPKINSNKDEIPLGMKPPPIHPPSLWPNRENLPSHIPVREHSTLREPFPPHPPNRNPHGGHSTLLDHISVHGPHRENGNHHSPSDGLPLLPPPMPKPELGAHIIVEHENHIPPKASLSSGLQTVFLGKPVPHGTDIIHGSPAPLPNTLDRSSGTPLLVNIQPSQVANVIIPSSTAPHIFNEHGAEFYDPSPYPLPESSPGFVGIGGPDSNPHNIHVGHYKPHVNQASVTRMDLPPSDTIDNITPEGINVEISPGQGINVDVSPIHGINVDVNPGQGINVDVSPGQGLNVEIAPGHYPQHGLKHDGERISPSGIVLDVPLQDRPGNDIIIGPPGRRPVHIVHGNHRPVPPLPQTQQIPPPPPLRIPPNNHVTVSTSSPHSHTFSHRPPPPSEFMVPPPLPHIKHDLVHNTVTSHGPVIPLHQNGHLGIKPEVLVDSVDKDDPLETDGGEVIEESNQRPLRPGQIPVEIQIANSASTHRPIVVKPLLNQGEIKHDEVLHQMKPPQSLFDKPLLPERPVKPHPDLRPNKPNHKDHPHLSISEERPYRTKPRPNPTKRPQISNNHESPQHPNHHERPVIDEIPEYSKPEVIIESRPYVTDNRLPVKNKPEIHVEESIHETETSNHQSGTQGIINQQSFSGKPDGNVNSENPTDVGPHQPLFDKNDNVYKSTEGLLFDLETQASTPRPLSILPPPQNRPELDFNSDEIVLGLSPPPPRVTPGGTSGQRFPTLGIEPQVSTHRPVVNIGNQRRPPSRNKPRPQPPYKFELPETTVPTTQLSKITQKTSTERPFWIRPPIHEISSPVGGGIPNRNENENVIKKPSPSQDSTHIQRRPITTWRPPLSPERPRPVKPLPPSPVESHTVIDNVESSVHLDDHNKILGSIKSVLSEPTQVLQTVVIGKPVPHEPVLSPTSVTDSSMKNNLPNTDISGTEDIIIGSESPIKEIQILATPSIIVHSRHSIVPSIASTVVSIGSNTIYDNLYTKPSSVSTIPPNSNQYKPNAGFTEIHHQEHEENNLSYNEKDNIEEEESDDDDDDEDLEFENNVNHKTDLGVASSNEDKIIYSSIEIPTQYITHTHTHTVTFTETTVVSSQGRQPSTRTLIITKTQLSTIVDTVTETKIHTLVKPTSITATVTTTVSATPSLYVPGSPFESNNYPTFSNKPVPSSPELGDKIEDEVISSSSTSTENKEHDEKNIYDTGRDNNTNNNGVDSGNIGENESIFVVVNDKNHATININKDDGNDEVANRDESDPSSEVNHAVLLGGVLIAAPPHHNMPGGEQGGSTCRPDCSAARNELCQKVEGHMRCVCRPGFARMFPDRPCKPTYTYTMQLGLVRHGKETLHYDETLTDHTSPQYHKLAEAAREGLDRMVMQSDLRDIYHGVIVNGFQPTDRDDGVNVNFYVQLSDNTDEARLQDVFRKSLRTTNYSLGGTEVFAHRELLHDIKADDFDECASSRFHDCSEHAQCFNLRGTYTCSCQDGYTDLSENPLFPGRLCSAELIGCEKCHYHGTCYSRGDDQQMCECFQWYAGENCQINLKVLLIALVTIGAVLLGLLIVCIVLTCLKRSSQRAHNSGTGFLRYRSPTHTLDKRAMIQDTSSEGSAEHGPISYLTPTHQPASTFGSQMKPALVYAGGRKVSGTVELSDEGMTYSDQRDRSLTVMIPRAKYRPIPPTSPLLAMSTFGVEQKRAIAQEQQKLLSYLETGNKETRSAANARRKQSNSTNHTNETAPPPSRKSSAPHKPSTGALVSAGFEVSATVVRKEPDSDTDIASAAVARSGGGDSNNANNNTLASNGSHFTTLRTNDSEITIEPETKAETASDSQQDTNSRVQELTVSEARSFDETTVQPPTKSLHSNYGSNPSSRNPNDEAHTMAERDLGSTLLMPQTHLYKPDRGSDISNFDSL